MRTKPAIVENVDLKQLSEEALHIIDILDRIEAHTLELRKKLMEELKQTNNSKAHLNLDEVS